MGKTTTDQVGETYAKVTGARYRDQIRLDQLADVLLGPEWAEPGNRPAMRKVLADVLAEYEEAHQEYVKRSQAHVLAVRQFLNDMQQEIG